MDYACFSCVTTPELAVALVAVWHGVTTTAGKYSTNVVGMPRELVLCLGNAAGMAVMTSHGGRRVNLFVSNEQQTTLPRPPPSIDSAFVFPYRFYIYSLLLFILAYINFQIHHHHLSDSHVLSTPPSSQSSRQSPWFLTSMSTYSNNRRIVLPILIWNSLGCIISAIPLFC